MNKGDILGIIIPFIIFCLIISYLIIQVHFYRDWVKEYVVSNYETCRIFEKGENGEKECIEYARGSVYSPYPFLKALFLINPND